MPRHSSVLLSPSRNASHIHLVPPPIFDLAVFLFGTTLSYWEGLCTTTTTYKRGRAHRLKDRFQFHVVKPSARKKKLHLFPFARRRHWRANPESRKRFPEILDE